MRTYLINYPFNALIFLEVRWTMVSLPSNRRWLWLLFFRRYTDLTLCKMGAFASVVPHSYRDTKLCLIHAFRLANGLSVVIGAWGVFSKPIPITLTYCLVSEMDSSLGELCSGSVTDTIMRHARKRALLRGETVAPELRLQAIWTGAILAPIGLLMWVFPA